MTARSWSSGAHGKLPRPAQPSGTALFTRLSQRRHSRGAGFHQFIQWLGGCHGFQSINGRLVGLDTQNTIDPMLIACPSCSTTYMSEPASLGPAGRTVRCARCQTTWFADASNITRDIAARFVVFFRRTTGQFTQFEIRQHANFEGSAGGSVFPCD